MNNTRVASPASPIEVPAHRAVSLRIVGGAAIDCLSGHVWITQEGDARDYVVPAGATFCADRTGHVVVTSIDGASIVVIQNRAHHVVPGTVSIFSIERIARAARDAQAAYMAATFARAGEWMLARVRRLLSFRRRSIPAPFPTRSSAGTAP